MSNEVVVTGIGPVTGFGVGIEPLWAAMLEGRSAIRRIEAFDPSGFTCHAGGELPKDAFSIRDWVPRSDRKSTKVMCRDIELAVAAAAAAVKDAGLSTRATGATDEDPPTIRPDRFGCHIGAGLISADLDELTLALASSRSEDGRDVDLSQWGAQGMQTLTPLWLLKYLPNMLACHVTIVHDCRGPSNTITCCEASGHLSLGESLRVIQRGAADACLSGGAESKLNPMAFARQQMSGRLRETEAADADGCAVRPFDPAADGTVIGEGGGILVLERADVAAARGATPYARLRGMSATQGHWTDARGRGFPEDDRSIADAIELALEQAGASADEVDAVVPFGSGVPGTDAAEARALASVFGDRAASIPVVTTVPFTGSCSAGNGAVALCVAAQMLRTQTLPARLHSAGQPGLDAGAADARPADLRTVVAVTTSQGGQNAAVVMSRV
ncbi:MAG: beta-ketoacyl synthase [Phycisphaerales bacterium]